MDLKSTYNKIAKDWMRDHEDDTWWIEGTDTFIKFLQHGSTVLDVGCGAGVKSKYLTEKGLFVVGIDFSEEMIGLAKERSTASKFLVMDIKQPLTFSESFDAIFAQAVLLHISKKEVRGVLKNLLAPLKAEGHFYVAVKELKKGSGEEEIVRENDYGYDYERFFSYYTLTELREYLEELGMTILYENVASSGKRPWIQVVARKSV